MKHQLLRKAMHTRRFAAGIFATLVVLWVSCTAAERSAREIQDDIDQMLAQFRVKGGPQAAIGAIVRHGSDAVKPLIQNYRRFEPEQRWAVVTCLCRIATPESVGFVRREVLGREENQNLMAMAIREFPQPYEGQIVGLLIEIAAGTVRGPASWEAGERLHRMIFRTPAMAGELVRALSDDHSSREKNWFIGEILASVTGYAHTGCCFRSDVDQVIEMIEFWGAWWKRNESKTPYEWVIETFHSDPGNASRRAEALQVLVGLQDPRAAELFRECLGDQSPGVREMAGIGLERLEHPHRPLKYEGEPITRKPQSIESLQSEMAPVPEVIYILKGTDLYRAASEDPGPANLALSQAWDVANEFVFRTALRAEYRLPAAESRWVTNDTAMVRFLARTGSQVLDLMVHPSSRTVVVAR